MLHIVINYTAPYANPVSIPANAQIRYVPIFLTWKQDDCCSCRYFLLMTVRLKKAFTPGNV